MHNGHSVALTYYIYYFRYGWFSKAELESATAQALSCTNIKEQSLNINIAAEQNSETENPSAPCNDQLVSAEQFITLTPSSTSTAIETVPYGVSFSNISTSRYHDSIGLVSSIGKESGDLAPTMQVENSVRLQILLLYCY